MTKSYKKLVVIFLIIFVIFFLLGTMLLNSQTKLSKDIKNIFPEEIKTSLKNTIFYFPTKFREIERSKKQVLQLELKVRNLNNKVDELRSKLESGKYNNLILSDKFENKYQLTKYFIDYSLPSFLNKKSKKNGYVETFKDNIIIILWSGKVMYLNKKDLDKDFIEFKNINTNINKFLTFDDEKFISVKDILVLDQKLYLSFTKNINPTKNCLNLSVIEADLFEENEKLSIGKFQNFFTYDECKEARFNGYQSGGRLYKYKDNNLLLTIGDFQNFTPAQDESSFFGKIVSINIADKKHRLISMGHRNPQGLLYDEKKNIILSTEHGQRGGDEVNLIFDNENGPVSNYGWPIASYSDYYGYENSSIKKIAPFKKNHKKFGFVEPLIYFTPAIGISQIINSSVFKKKYQSDVFLVTSMKEKKIVFLELKQDNNKAEVINELVIGERIRDIVILDENHYLLYLEDTPSLGILSLK